MDILKYEILVYLMIQGKIHVVDVQVGRCHMDEHVQHIVHLRIVVIVIVRKEYQHVIMEAGKDEIHMNIQVVQKYLVNR